MDILPSASRSRSGFRSEVRDGLHSGARGGRGWFDRRSCLDDDCELNSARRDRNEFFIKFLFFH